MSIALYNEIRAMQAQILDLLKRIESLEESRLEARKKREILTIDAIRGNAPLKAPSVQK